MHVQIDPAANPDADPLVAAHWATTAYQYDENGYVSKTTDPVGNITETAYDKTGNLLRTIQKLPDGTTEVLTTEYSYDQSGRLIFTGTHKDSVWSSMTLNYYDAGSRLTDTVQVCIDGSDIADKDDLVVFDEQSGYAHLYTADNLPNAGTHIRTTYDYDVADSGSHDQPYSVSEPYPDNGSAVYTRFMHYNANGAQDWSYLEWIDPAGGDAYADQYVYTVNHYDSAGRVIKTERKVNSTALNDPVNNTADSTVVLSQTKYNAIGKVDTSIDENGQLTKFEYDQAGNIVETRTYQSLAIYEYNADSYLTISRTLYDAEGRVLVSLDTHAKNEAANGTENVYDALGRVTETRRWADVEITVATETAENSELIVSATGWTSDGKTPTIASSLSAGEIGPLSYTKTIYDVAGRVKHSIALDADGVEQVTTYEYDTAGKQTATIDPLGHYLDNPNNNLYVDDIRLYDGTIQVKKVNFANFDYSVYEDPANLTGNFTGTHKSQTHYEGTRRDYVIDARSNQTDFTYDALGRLEKTTHPSVDYIDKSNAPQTGNLFTYIGYDVFGRKKWQTEPTYNQGTPDDTDGLRQFEYDTAGRLIKVTMPKPTPSDANPVYRYIYDDYGNQVGIIDAKDRMTVFEYDHLGNQTAKHMPFIPTNPLPADIDTAGEVYTALSNASPAPNVQTKEYDEFGRLEKSIDYEGQVTGYVYNFRGQPAYIEYFNTESDYPANPAEIMAITYDDLGRKDEVFVDDTSVQHFAYDTEGRIYTIDTPQGAIGYGYDEVTGKRNVVLTPDTDVWANIDTKTGYLYDAMGRLKEVIVEKRNTVDLMDDTPTGEEERIVYDYTDTGSLDTVTRVVDGTDILTTKYLYDAMNRLTGVTNKDSSQTTLSSFAYTHYADGQRESVTELDSTTIDWRYDNLNRLVKEDYDAPGTNDDYVHDYQFDLASNRTQWTKDGTPTYYFCNAKDELEKETSDQDGINVLVSYQYDDNGSMTQKAVTGGDTTVYDYTLQGYLESVTIGSNPTITYAYDPDGIRISKQVGSNNPVNYLIDAFNPTGYEQVIKQTQTGSDDVAFIIGHDVLAQATGTAAPVFMLTDAHGSVRNLADNGGALISGQRYDYDAYGNIVNTVTPQTNMLYSGEWRDMDIENDYLRARWLDFATGRMISKDVYPGHYASPLSLHRYMYANANPIMNVDPTGQFAVAMMTDISVANAVRVNIGMSIAVNAFLIDHYIRYKSGVAHKAAGQEIETFVQSAPSPLTQFDFDALENRIKNRLGRRNKKKLYLHYSSKEHSTSLLMNGLFDSFRLPPDGSFATRTVYSTGWAAKYKLALKHKNPPDSIYVVLPRYRYGPTRGPENVLPAIDKQGLYMGGGGIQYIFGLGSGGSGTVFGPIPLPEGQYIW